MEPLPKYWSPAEDRVQDPAGKTYVLRLWGWSVTSPSHAAVVAARRLGEVLQKIRTGRPLGGGYYPRTPLREEVLEEIRDSGGDLIGVITRNAYGAAILNTDRILIADVDDPAAQAAPGLLSTLGRLFGRGKRDQPAGPEDNPVPARIEEFARVRPHLGVYLYRTAAGFRVLITGVHAAPDSAEAGEILTALASDPIYVRLCTVHGNYRARLTPKPWRCGMRALKPRWPWLDERAAGTAAQWLDRYRERTGHYAVCRLLRAGRTAPSAQERQLLQRHDQFVLGHGDLPLA
ncbi:hypothetical protein ACO0LV_15695 [Pseudactinotalea sp. Z1739]|uniref:hypothetical protein n=1 Tax=Pseudactinotalea sp. Z1739 TaxID=3413028 RepID=UPI003C7B395F